MAVTESFRRQHGEFIDIIRDLRPLLEPEQLTADPRRVRGMLLTLFGKFSVHLAVEDEALYPRCKQHTDPKIRQLAAKFADEMSNTKTAVESFARKWSDAKMRSQAAEFCSEAKALFVALEDRIHRENTELYVLVDRAG